MEKIQHLYLDINGLKLHLAQLGNVEAVPVVFLHGFPEIWYTWRHQMIAVADAGYRAIAPDSRGYGLSQAPPEEERASWSSLVADLLGILDSLSLSKVYVVGKDWGASTAYHFALVHPDRTLGVVTLGIPFISQPVPFQLLPGGFYILRWQEPGRAEADFGRFDVRTVVRNIYIMFSGSELPVAKEDQEIMDTVDPSTHLPQWFTEEDLTAYATLYEKSKFTYPLKKYRTMMSEELNLTNKKVEVPSLLIMGEKDYVRLFPGMDNYIRSGDVKNYVPDLEITFIPEGSHFVHEQFPGQVNELIINFLKKHT
ncbi:hypothetical protein QJS10_CPB21g00565 [Acorus calamus]|uniref:AB hydrolase-1 domain-containing protein n=1 Tax=Acorus calamus TaxID=4465 RepID=A0AAV9C8A4_ACOCL|nr:hypothetical protein QJS10_CPB21g00565 [Acorus calamus]